jgi:hypothetical protein
VDGSSLAEAALPAARFLADKLHAMVTLLQVIEKTPKGGPGLPGKKNFPGLPDEQE